MSFDFTTCPDRRNTGSEKWDRYAGTDVIPMWVADMDFKTAPSIIDALHARIDHGVFGYTSPTSEQNAAICAGMKFYFDWEIDPDWIVWLPNLVTGITHAVRGLTEPGEGVMMMPPIYPPFLHAPHAAKRKRVDVPLRPINNHWTFDDQELSAATALPDTKLLLWCHPHNPVGRAWTETELRTVAESCLENDVTICSDEIHCNLVFDNRKHLPTAMLSPEIADQTITLMAPSKTWNLPGVACGFAIISNEKLRRKYCRAMRGFPRELNCLSYVAAATAYATGEPWRQQLMAQLHRNRDLVTEAVARWPGFSMTPLEATYLAWIDCRESGIENPTACFEKAGVGVCPGEWYGLSGYVRLNFGCSESQLLQALDQMETAIQKASQNPT